MAAGPCSYGEHCRVANDRAPAAQLNTCGAQGCSHTLHHLCQAEYEAQYPELVENNEMNKRCLTCILKDKAPITLHRLAISSSSQRSARGSSSSQRVQQTCGGSEALSVDILDDEEEYMEPEVPPCKRGGQKGKRRTHMKRVSLTKKQQVDVIQYVQGCSLQDRPSLTAIGAWAKDKMKLKSQPSKALLSKILKESESILSEFSLHACKDHIERKRKRVVKGEQERLETMLLQWITHHDATHGGKFPLSNNMILEKAKSLATQHELSFDQGEFIFSGKWLTGFKKAHNINRMAFHGEGADADSQSVEIVRKQLPRILADKSLDTIYNFDETGLFYQMLLTAGNVMGGKQGRRGGKTAKDRMTVGLFCNATGTNLWKPVFIAKTKKPRCFGKHWNPEKIGALYYNNESSWMRNVIWLDVLRKFNRYCYSLSGGGADPVILLSDNCAAHGIPPEAKQWKSGDLKGFRMTNLLVIFFQPNCTSKVQPLDAGCIQSAKALYRKRHMSWILEQLAAADAAGTKPAVRCNVRQAMEWFMAALQEMSAATVANCWVVTEILTPAQMLELSTGIRHNNRAAPTEAPRNKNCVSSEDLGELSDMLSKLSTSLASDKNHPVRMAQAEDVLDLPMEREVFEPPEVEPNATSLLDSNVDDAEAEAEDDLNEGGEMIDLSDEDTNDIAPVARVPSLHEARKLVQSAFVCQREQ